MIDGDSVRSDRRIATEIVPSTFIDNETCLPETEGDSNRERGSSFFFTEDEI